MNSMTITSDMLLATHHREKNPTTLAILKRYTNTSITKRNMNPPKLVTEQFGGSSGTHNNANGLPSLAQCGGLKNKIKIIIDVMAKYKSSTWYV